MWILSKLSMSHRKRINAGDSPCIDVQYQNLYAQVASLLMPRKLRAVLGRGSAKTTDFQAERLAEIIFDMPGAPLVWVADTFSNRAAAGTVFPRRLSAYALFNKT